MEQPIFEVTEPSGKVYRIWANGKLQGFEAEGAIVSNGIMPALDYLRGLIVRAKEDPDGAAEKSKEFMTGEGLMCVELSPTLQFMSMSDEPFHLTHMLMIQMENDSIGDGNSGVEFAEALRCYADMILSGKAGRRSFEMLANARGTRMTAIAGTGNAAQLLLEEIHTPIQAP